MHYDDYDPAMPIFAFADLSPVGIGCMLAHQCLGLLLKDQYFLRLVP